jgi:UDP-glucose 4-epimerase
MILLTGATGYVGAALRAALEQRESPLRLAGRSAENQEESAWVHHDLSDKEAPSGTLLADVSCVIHCAGVAHRYAGESDFRRINVEGTVRLAKAAVAAGVPHFVYVSSMNVVPVDAQSAQETAQRYPEPSEAYAASKWQAEHALTGLFANTACLLTIIRPGLIYDAELTANLKTMERLLRWWPLLFPAIGRRSMLARADLVDLLISCARGNAGAPAGEGVIAATDGECYDAQRISRALSMTTKRGVMPRWLCRMGCRVLDRVRGYPAGASWQGLSSSHWYGPAPAISGWQPEQVLESRSANEGSASR